MTTNLVSHDFDNLKDFRDTVAEVFTDVKITSGLCEMLIMGEVIDARKHTACDSEGLVLAQVWYAIGEDNPVCYGNIRLSN